MHPFIVYNKSLRLSPDISCLLPFTGPHCYCGRDDPLLGRAYQLPRLLLHVLQLAKRQIRLSFQVLRRAKFSERNNTALICTMVHCFDRQRSCFDRRKDCFDQHKSCFDQHKSFFEKHSSCFDQQKALLRSVSPHVGLYICCTEWQSKQWITSNTVVSPVTDTNNSCFSSNSSCGLNPHGQSGTLRGTWGELVGDYWSTRAYVLCAAGHWDGEMTLETPHTALDKKRQELCDSQVELQL